MTGESRSLGPNLVLQRLNESSGGWIDSEAGVELQGTTGGNRSLLGRMPEAGSMLGLPGVVGLD